MKRFQVLTFDLDDTLWPVDPVVERANGIQYDWLARHVPGFRERFPRQALIAFAREEARRRPELDDFVTRKRKHLLRRVMEECEIPATQIDALVEAAFSAFREARQQVKFYPGVLQVLHALARDYRLWAVSNGNADIFRTAAGPSFTGQMSAESCGVAKPDPAIFHATLERAGVGAEETLHIGDHPDTDVAGAIRAGLQAVWVNREGAPWPSGLPDPGAEISSLDELPELLAGWKREIH